MSRIDAAWSRQAVRWSLRCGVGTVFAVAIAAVATVAVGYARAVSLLDRYRATHAMGTRLADLPAPGLDALLAVEDPAFYHHHGIDFWTPGAGYTTITQGLVKFLYFDDFRPGWRKVAQTLLAIGFDARIAKRDQLELFVDAVYLGTARDGGEIHGFAPAALELFGKPLPALGRREFLALVAAVVSPNQLNPRSQAPANAERVRRLERLLAGQCAPAGFSDVMYTGCRD